MLFKFNVRFILGSPALRMAIQIQPGSSGNTPKIENCWGVLKTKEVFKDSGRIEPEFTGRLA